MMRAIAGGFAHMVLCRYAIIRTQWELWVFPRSPRGVEKQSARGGLRAL